MNKHIITIFLLCSTVIFSQNQNVANWVLVDTLPHPLGPASSNITPLDYDPYSKALVLLHEGDLSYSSRYQLWYNLSLNGGLDWYPRKSIDADSGAFLDYPSLHLINQTGGSTVQDVVAFADWSGDPGTFTLSKVDDLLNDSSYTNHTLNNVWVYGLRCFSLENWKFWVLEDYSSGDKKLVRTNDFVSFESISFPQFTFGLKGVGYNGNLYCGALADFTNESDRSDLFYALPGYSKSTDYGLTWSDFKVADFKTIPALAHFDRIYDFIKEDPPFSSLMGDMNVDADGYVHFVTVLTDTITANSGTNSVVHIYETASGWDGEVIFSGISDNIFTQYLGPAWGQMGPNTQLAFDKDREKMACAWVSDNPQDGINLCDIWISYRNGNQWSDPVNLTNTPNMNENGMHLAPTLEVENSSTATAYLGYFYQ